MGEGILRFGHAHRKVAIAPGANTLQFTNSLGGQFNAIGLVKAGGDGGRFVEHVGFRREQGNERSSCRNVVLHRFDHGFSQILAASPTVRMNFGDAHRLCAALMSRFSMRHPGSRRKSAHAANETPSGRAAKLLNSIRSAAGADGSGAATKAKARRRMSTTAASVPAFLKLDEEALNRLADATQPRECAVDEVGRRPKRAACPQRPRRAVAAA